MCITDSTMSGVSAKTGLRFGMPALLTSTSIPPSSDEARCANGAMPVEICEIDGPRSRFGGVHAAFLEHRLQPVRASCADTHGRAPLGEALRERGADARRRAGHQHVLPTQVVRHGAKLAFPFLLALGAGGVPGPCD